SESNQADAQFGWSVATAGDVNADGFSDVIVGSRHYNNPESREGRAFVWLGSAAGLGPNGTPVNADWSAESNQANAWYASAVATAGDVNGD
ncbi:integrin alpha, partial [Pseudomonas baetica]|uniref:integrin alpha n=1 Tax=Pseudomonas baetica TaxID=674054 RepID=UPI00287147ED